ncbi:MAG TPA: TonB-dependent receptor [Rudaea sp.]|nr:TonB-dependent receptor [Rudaea sp.]
MNRSDKLLARCRALLTLVFAFAAVTAFAQAPAPGIDFSIAPQPLSSALIEFAKQANVQVLTAGSNLENSRTRGVSGKFSAREALNRLLDGTAFVPEFTDAATVVIKPSAARPAAPARSAQARAAREGDPPPAELEQVTVTGSHIPRAEIEGPAPITVITAADITGRGFATVADIMTSLTQNLGALDNNQYTNGFSPGAQAVDLRGLGPNHTLILINGRRIADYPQAYGGNSNFTDITNIPASLLDRVEILSGSASAVYGSDAISGVINFIMKTKADGTTIDLRAGDTQHGGGASQRFTITSGWSNDRFDSVFGVELYRENPLWAYQRSFTDSRTDGPGTVVPSQVFVRMDEDENYFDPGADQCAALSSLDQGSIFYAHRRNYGYYCGSNRDVAYGTLENGRKAANFYGSATYHFTDHMDFFVDLQYSTSHQDSYNTPLQWQNSYPLNGDSTPIPFFNQATGLIEQWQRRYFTIEENGGFKPGEIRNINNTLSLNTGIKGTFGEAWNYEALFSHSQNQLESKWPALISAKAQALYLGPSLGTDPDSGLEIYNAPISRLYTPLTVAEFRSITQDSIDNDKSRAENYSFTLNNTELFELPAGPVGFAALGEYGNQYFGMKPDPLSLDGSYYGLHNTGAVGSRSHEGAGAELSVPVFSQLKLSAASRYDRYEYSDNSSSKLTYALGLEYRPFDSLLLRGSASTGFRAPDLTYLYAGLSGSSSGGIDYYRCRRDEPGVDIDDCDFSDESFNGRSHGSTSLKNETSRSFTYGFVYSPMRGLDFTADYYIISLKNEVEYQSSDDILRFEADCRLHTLDINSSFCQQIIGQVVRNPANATSNPEGITSVMVLPINAATDRTSGIDFAAHYLLDADNYGRFNFNLGYTYVVTHEVQLSPDVPVDNILTDYYYYVLPRSKANYSVAWTIADLTTTLYGARLGGIPNYDGDKRMGPTFVYNGTLVYRFNDRAMMSLTVNNLFDSRPGKDSSWTSYPYYSRNWFSPVGRAWFVDFSYHFGGKG